MRIKGYCLIALKLWSQHQNIFFEILIPKYPACFSSYFDLNCFRWFVAINKQEIQNKEREENIACAHFMRITCQLNFIT